MKKLIYNFLIVLVLAGSALSVQSCSDWLDINTNELTSTKVEPGYLFSNAALNYSMKRCGGDQFITSMYAVQTASEGTAWFLHLMGGQPYEISEFPTGNAWVGTYSSTGYNLQRAIGFAQENGNKNAGAQCKILTAYVFWETTMLFGDIPYSEAWNIDTIKEPKFDTQEQVLKSLLNLLDEAIGEIDGSGEGAITSYDLYYKGDMTKWRKLAKSMKLKILMYLANKEDVSGQTKALIDDNDFMESTADSFAFPFFDSPGNKNPNFQFGANNPGIIEMMYFGHTSIVDPMNAVNDPRRPYYFYANKDGEYIGIESTVEGSVITVENNSDIVEAKFNEERLFAADSPDVIFTYSDVMFYLAEAYARGLGVAKNMTTADEYYKKGIEASCTAAGVKAAEAKSFVEGLPALSTLGGDEKAIEAIATQMRIEMMMRPVEAWSEQRRLDYPKLEVPVMIRSLYSGLICRWPYPTRESLVNDNVPQIEGVWEKMWFQK